VGWNRGLARSGAHALILSLLLGGSGEAQAGTPDAPAPSLSLSLDPRLPQNGGFVLAPAPGELPVRAPPDGRAWKVWLSGYLRAPLRWSWGPATTPDPNGGNPGTQVRTPPLVPDATTTDWRYSGSLVPPWTELDFHVGTARVQATVQIASENITDAGYRQLAANLGINQSYLTIRLPDLAGGGLHVTIAAGGFSNRYGAAGRFDAGKYDTYLFGRTHVAGEALTLAADLGDWSLLAEQGFGGKLEPVPFYKTAPIDPTRPPTDPARAWDPRSGPSAQESTLINHGHLGLRYRDQLLLGVHVLDVFANDNDRTIGLDDPHYVRPPSVAPPRLLIVGADAKWLSTPVGDGYLGYAHLDARNADYLGGAVDVLSSAEGWQLHDNFFGVPGAIERATGRIDTVLFQDVISIGRLLRGQSFAGGAPDLVAAAFAMWSRVSGAVDPAFDHAKLKAGGELTYLPLPWLALGGRFDLVAPNLDDATQSFWVASPRILLRTAFMTHEQILLQYSRYFYGANAAHGPFPYGNQMFAANLGADRDAAQIAAIIWF
jgi:hypothetical protein